MGWDICGSFTRPKTRRGGAAKSHPSLCGSWLLASRAYSSRSGLLTTMIRCRYQELDLAECHAVATAVCHCAAASAHCPQTGLRRSGTDGSPIPRRRKRDSNFWSHLQEDNRAPSSPLPFFGPSYTGCHRFSSPRMTTSSSRHPKVFSLVPRREETRGGLRPFGCRSHGETRVSGHLVDLI